MRRRLGASLYQAFRPVARAYVIRCEAVAQRLLDATGTISCIIMHDNASLSCGPHCLRGNPENPASLASGSHCLRGNPENPACLAAGSHCLREMPCRAAARRSCLQGQRKRLPTAVAAEPPVLGVFAAAHNHLGAARPAHVVAEHEILPHDVCSPEGGPDSPYCLLHRLPLNDQGTSAVRNRRPISTGGRGGASVEISALNVISRIGR